MEHGRWQECKTPKKCQNCDRTIRKRSRYLQLRYILEGETNVTRLHFITLCRACVGDLSDFLGDDFESV